MDRSKSMCLRVLNINGSTKLKFFSDLNGICGVMTHIRCDVTNDVRER